MRELNLSWEEAEEMSFVPSASAFHEDLCFGVTISDNALRFWQFAFGSFR